MGSGAFLSCLSHPLALKRASQSVNGAAGRGAARGVRAKQRGDGCWCLGTARSSPGASAGLVFGVVWHVETRRKVFSPVGKGLRLRAPAFVGDSWEPGAWFPCRTRLGALSVPSLLRLPSASRVPSLCSSMKSTRSSSSFQGAGSGGVDLSLTGLPAPVSRRPSSACPAKHMARSVSVTADGKPKRNALVSAGWEMSFIPPAARGGKAPVHGLWDASVDARSAGCLNAGLR